MARPILLTVVALLALAAVTFAEPSPSIEDIRQEVLARIQAANVTLPAGGGGGLKSLQSYRIIDPFIIADLINAIAFVYSSIIYNYPNFLLYDTIDLRLLSAQYIPQRIEFNYVNRV